MSDRPPMMTVQDRTIAADKKLKVEMTVSSPGPPVGREDRFVKPSFKSLELACRVAFKVRFQ